MESEVVGYLSCRFRVFVIPVLVNRAVADGPLYRAMLNGQSHVSMEDIRALVHPILRHRLLLGYKAEADGVTVEDCVDRLLSEVK